MTDPAIITATFSDWRPVKSRKVLQLIFEVPVEQTEKVLNTLGAPMPHEDNWCAIAVLTKEARSLMVKPDAHNVHDAGSSPAAPTKKRFDELSRAQQAGILCSDANFQRWVCTQTGVSGLGEGNIENSVADMVRLHCGVTSRSELDDHTEPGQKWDALIVTYRQATGQLTEDRS